MSRRATLAQLMALIAALALGLAAMKAATEGMERLGFASMMLALLVATLGAIVRRSRGPWVGFALFGWTYGLVALVPPIRQSINEHLHVARTMKDFVGWLHPQPVNPMYLRPDFVDRIRSDESTKRHMKVEHSRFQDEPLMSLTADEQKAWDEYLPVQVRYEAWQDTTKACPQVGHRFLAFAFASLGAFIGRRLAGPPGDPTRPR